MIIFIDHVKIFYKFLNIRVYPLYSIDTNILETITHMANAQKHNSYYYSSVSMNLFIFCYKVRAYNKCSSILMFSIRV